MLSGVITESKSDYAVMTSRSDDAVCSRASELGTKCRELCVTQTRFKSLNFQGTSKRTNCWDVSVQFSFSKLRWRVRIVRNKHLHHYNDPTEHLIIDRFTEQMDPESYVVHMKLQ